VTPIAYLLKDRHAKELSDMMQANKTAVTILIEEHKVRVGVLLSTKLLSCLLWLGIKSVGFDADQPVMNASQSQIVALLERNATTRH